MEKVCIAADIGGTNLRCALVTETGVILRREQCSTDVSGSDNFLSQLLRSVERLKDAATGEGLTVQGVGLGVPGLVCSDGAVYACVNLSCLNGVKLAHEVSQRCGVPVLALNDANASALGEFRFGAARPFRSSVTVTIGTGVGSGLILDGRLWTGIDGAAGELGHVTVEPQGRPCGCGNRGCLEQYLSASAIAAAARNLAAPDAAADFPHGAAPDAAAASTAAAPDAAAPDAAAVAERAVLGDAAALAIFEEAGRYLGIAAAGILNLLNLEAIVLGGGVARSFDLIAPAVRREIAGRAFAVPANRARILCGELGDNAGILGAAAAAFGARESENRW